MRNNWNSAERSTATVNAEAVEGMECGSLDRFQHSSPDVTVVSVPWVASDWPIARRFWASFQVADPAELSHGLCRSARSMRDFKQSMIKARSARPSEIWQLQEKLKIAATVTALELLYSSRCPNPNDHAIIRKAVFRLIYEPSEAFDLTWAIRPEPGSYPEGLLYRSRGKWRSALTRDFEHLTTRQGL